MNKKIVVLHDYLLHKGGGERLVLTLAKQLDCLFVTGYQDAGAFDPKDFGVEGLTLGKPVHYPGFRYLAIQYWFRFKTSFLKQYDTVIFSANCIQAVHNCRKDAVKIFYCHTPIRNAYDLYDYYIARMPWWKAFAYAIFCIFIRWNYERDLKKFDLIVANSKNIQARIKQYLKKDSVVVYPPIDTNKFQWISDGDYYLSYARLDLVKRVDIIAQAFAKMPDKKLIIASTGTEVDRVIKIIEGKNNIQYLGRVSDEELQKLVGNCLATIYIPQDEDFGMSPLEGMAAGKPCIGVDEGGLRETIIHGKNGLLIPAQAQEEDLIQAIEQLDQKTAVAMKEDCMQQAQKFSEEIFIQKMKQVVEEVRINKKTT